MKRLGIKTKEKRDKVNRKYFFSKTSGLYWLLLSWMAGCGGTSLFWIDEFFDDFLLRLPFCEAAKDPLIEFIGAA